MSPAQWAIVAALLALAVVGIPAAAIAWTAGRWALRAALDPARLPPVANPDVRVVTTSPLAVGGRFPDTPAALWSQVKAAEDRTARVIAEQTAETEEEIRTMTALAEETLRARTRVFW